MRSNKGGGGVCEFKERLGVSEVRERGVVS